MRKAFLILAIILIFPLVASKIAFIDNPDKTYNVGDTIFVEFSIRQEIPSSGFVESYLICGNKEELFYKNHYSFSQNEEEHFSLTSPTSMKGDCTIDAEFKSEKESSDSFEITDKINVDFSINSKSFLPLEKITLNGSAIKKNSEALEGLASIQIGNFYNTTTDISNGKLSFDFEIPQDTPPGNYSLKISAYEKNSEGLKINHGDSEKHFEIKSKPTFIEISSKDELTPPHNLEMTPTLLNQIKDPVQNESIVIKIFDTENNILYEDAKKSGSSFKFQFPDNAQKGGWKIIAYYGNIVSTKQIYINENSKINLTIENQTSSVIVENIGNTYYEKVIELSFENGTENFTLPLNINLSIGEEETYPLELEGVYNVSTEEENLGNIYITGAVTGAAISPGTARNLSIIIFILVVSAIGTFIVLKNRKKKNPSQDKNNFYRNEKEKPEKEIKTKKYLSENKNPNKEYYKGTFSQNNSEKTVNKTQSNSKPVEHKKPHSDSETKKENNKKIYSVFFNSHFDEISSMLKRKKYELHTMGSNYHFTIIRSEKNLNYEVLNLAKEIYSKFPDTGILINSKEFNKNISSIRESFIPKSIVEPLKGIFVTENFYKNLGKPISTAFSEYKSFKFKLDFPKNLFK